MCGGGALSVYRFALFPNLSLSLFVYGLDMTNSNVAPNNLEDVVAFNFNFINPITQTHPGSLEMTHW